MQFSFLCSISFFQTYEMISLFLLNRPEGKKVKKARDYGKPVVNVQWLNEIIFGHFSCIYQPDLPKFQQYNMGNPFKIEYILIMHLMSKYL